LSDEKRGAFMVDSGRRLASLRHWSECKEVSLPIDCSSIKRCLTHLCLQYFKGSTYLSKYAVCWSHYHERLQTSSLSPHGKYWGHSTLSSVACFMRKAATTCPGNLSWAKQCRKVCVRGFSQANEISIVDHCSIHLFLQHNILATRQQSLAQVFINTSLCHRV